MGEDTTDCPRSSTATKKRSDSEDGVYLGRTSRRRLRVAWVPVQHGGGEGWSNFRNPDSRNSDVTMLDLRNGNHLRRDSVLAAGVRHRHGRALAHARHLQAAGMLCRGHGVTRCHARRQRLTKKHKRQRGYHDLGKLVQHLNSTVVVQWIGTPLKAAPITRGDGLRSQRLTAASALPLGPCLREE